MSDFKDPAKTWDERYGDNETVYGEAPNIFFKEYIDKQNTGQLLLPCEGEGRNAIYAAQKGWEVDAFDFSETAIQKAMKLVEKANVIIHYDKKRIEDFAVVKKYDLIALVYVHISPLLRTRFHHKLIDSLNDHGTIVLEAFNQSQLHYNSGGPKDIAMLYSREDLLKDFMGLRIELLEERNILLSEGPFHSGEGAVIRLIATK